MDISKKLKKNPIKKNIIISGVLITIARDKAAIVLTSVPRVPIIKLLPKTQVHFFNDEKLLKSASGIIKNKTTKDKIDNPNAIHKLKITLGIKLRLNSTDKLIPKITLIIDAVMLLQEFCLHIY